MLYFQVKKMVKLICQKIILVHHSIIQYNVFPHRNPPSASVVKYTQLIYFYHDSPGAHTLGSFNESHLVFLLTVSDLKNKQTAYGFLYELSVSNDSREKNEDFRKHGKHLSECVFLKE